MDFAYVVTVLLLGSIAFALVREMRKANPRPAGLRGHIRARGWGLALLPLALMAAVMTGHVHALAVAEIAVAGALVTWAPRLAAKLVPYSPARPGPLRPAWRTTWAAHRTVRRGGRSVGTTGFRGLSPSGSVHVPRPVPAARVRCASPQAGWVRFRSVLARCRRGCVVPRHARPRRPLAHRVRRGPRR